MYNWDSYAKIFKYTKAKMQCKALLTCNKEAGDAKYGEKMQVIKLRGCFK
jgi:hypothetical protein